MEDLPDPSCAEPASPGCPLVGCERMRRTHQGAMAAAHTCPTAGWLWRVQAETLLSPNPAAEAAAAGVTFSCCVGPCSKTVSRMADFLTPPPFHLSYFSSVYLVPHLFSF